jgi:kinesin family member C1
MSNEAEQASASTSSAIRKAVETAALIDRDRQIAELTREVTALRAAAASGSAAASADVLSRLAASEVAATNAQRALQAAEQRASAAVSAAQSELAAVQTKLAAAEESERTNIASLQRQLEDAAAAREALQNELTAAASAAAKRECSQAAQIDALKERLVASESKRVALHEQVLSLKGAIRVFVRVRPTLPTETDAEAKPQQSAGSKAKAPDHADAAPLPPLFSFPDATDDASAIEVVERPGAGVGGYGVGDAKRTRFSFQRVLPPTACQSDLFSEVEGLVLSTLAGQRTCIFAYGQVRVGGGGWGGPLCQDPMP